MRGTWMFKAVRHGGARTAITRNAERVRRTRTVEGTEREALEFARRACEYLRPKGVEAVEAWSLEISDFTFHNSEGEPEVPRLMRFCLKPHGNGRDWIAEQNELHHGGWWGDLEEAIDYALFRGSGRICAVEIWKRKAETINPRNDAKKREIQIQTVVLVDRTATDACPTQGRGKI